MPVAARHSATLIGTLAIPIWASFPALTVLAGPIPPLELVALTFSLGAAVGFVFLGLSPASRRGLHSPALGAVLLGVGGLFSYHFSFFLALQHAPAIEATLIDYLWPVLIVVFSTALPASTHPGRLTPWHIFGALTACAGAALAIGGGTRLTWEGNGFGYAMALAAAIIWAAYSVATRLFRQAPSSAVAFSCAGTAMLAWVAHAGWEAFVFPASASAAAAIAVLGAGPLGLAFYLWDHGCKHGDLRVLAAASYFAPLLATAILIATGLGSPKPALPLAAVLITGGALLAGKDLVKSLLSGAG